MYFVYRLAEERTLTLKQLAYFVDIVKYGSVSRAARHLLVSQPALSRAIQMLETSLGVQLFERTTRNYRLTSAGERFYRRASFILSELESSKHELAARNIEKESIAIVSGTPMTAPRLIPEAATRLITEHPGMWLSIHGEMDTDHVRKIELLMNGNLDVVLSFTDQPAKADGLTREHLFAPDLKIIARKGHTIANDTDLSVKALARFQWIFPPTGTGPRQVFDNEFNAAGIGIPANILEISNRQMILSIVRRSDFVTAIPYHPACTEDDWSDFYVVPAPFAMKPLSIGIITRSRALLGPAARTFIEIIRTLVEESERPGHSDPAIEASTSDFIPTR